MDSADVVLRNLYPPRVSGMAAPTRILGSWAWEESGLPAVWVARFNHDLNLITTVSRFVAKVLTDNGVKVPVAVVGDGADHLQGVTPVAPSMPLRTSLAKGGFRFLHVSSGFPRKGVDALLEAWSRAFTRTDDVTLLIKTFPNPHNDVAAQIEELGRRCPSHAEIILIDAELKAAEMTGLYRTCHALVAPSRGEGFGLPVAEAMLHDLPVIATGHGGLLEFCSEQTAWLVDYRFSYADTHFGLFGSVWAEPNIDDLARALREVRAASVEQRATRSDAARQLVEKVFTWPAVARRTQAAVTSLDRRPAITPWPRVAWVTSWNIRCGIAAYARYLAGEFPSGTLQVLASHSSELLQPDEPYVQRCWTQGWDDDLEELYRAVLTCGATVAVFQFNFGFYKIEALGRLLDRLRDEGVACHVMLHSTLDVTKPGVHISLGQIRGSLSRAARLLVHGVSDLNTLKGFGLIDNVALFPHGTACPIPVDPSDLRRRMGLQGKRVIGSFGYLLPNKGLRQLIEAFVQMRSHRPDLHLLLLNALYPVPDSADEAARCRQLIDSHSAGSSITLFTDYLAEDHAHAYLQLADLIVFPYQHTQESSSAAVRFGLASHRPVACTPLSIFEDVARVVHRLPGTTAEDLARGLEVLISDPMRLGSLAELQTSWLAAHDWTAVSTRFWNMLRAPPILDLVEVDRG